MDDWNTIVSFWGPAYFQVGLLLVSGSVSHDCVFPTFLQFGAPLDLRMFRQPVTEAMQGGFFRKHWGVFRREPDSPCFTCVKILGGFTRG